MRTATAILILLLTLLTGCGSVPVETPQESPETRSLRLAGMADSLAAQGQYAEAVEAYVTSAMLLPPGDPRRAVLARKAAAASREPNLTVARLLIESPDSVTVFEALRLGGGDVAPELGPLVLSGEAPYGEYASLAVAECLVNAGRFVEAREFLTYSGDNLPGRAGTDHLILSYRVALGTGDTSLQETLWRRAEALGNSEMSAAMRHHRGMHKRSMGYEGWENDLLASFDLWPAGDMHAAAYAVLRETLFNDPVMASSVAENFYGGGLWNELYEIAIRSPNPPPNLHYLAGRTRDRLGFYREAADMLSEHLRRWPRGAEAPDAAINLGRSLAALGMVEEALDVFDTYQEKWPSHVRISNLPWYRGSLLAENGHWERALPYFRETIARYPGNTTADDAHYYLCVGLMKTGDPGAAQEFSSFIERWTQSVYRSSARYWYGRLLLEAGDSRGQSVLQGLVADSPESLPAVFAREYLNLPPWQPHYTGEPLEEWMTRNNRAPAAPPEEALAGAYLSSVGRRAWAQDLFRAAESRVGGAFRLGPFYARHEIWERGPWAAYTMWSLEGSERPLELWRLRYPKAWEAQVAEAGQRYHIDPLLIYSIMKQESGYSPWVYSTAGARGLLQMIPSTSEYVAAERGWEGFTPDMLYIPSVSIEYGIACISSYRDQMGGDIRETLAAYNGGPHNALRWGAGRVAPEEFFGRITFNETKKYVEIVSHNYTIYRSIWP